MSIKRFKNSDVRHEGVRGSGDKALLILSLGTTWSSVVRSAAWQLYLKVKKKAQIPTESETRWAPEPVWMQSIRETCVANARKQAMLRFFSLQRSHYAGWAIVALLIQSNYKPQEQEQAGTQTGVPMSWQFALTNGSLFLRLTQTQGQAACLSNSSRSSPVTFDNDSTEKSPSSEANSRPAGKSQVHCRFPGQIPWTGYTHIMSHFSSHTSNKRWDTALQNKPRLLPLKYVQI
jgi:hypothetical protein